jgi:predicted Zn-dependent peptidase
MLCLVGGFDGAQARRAIEDTFGTISRSPASDEPPRLPRNSGDRTVRWDIKTRHLILAWPTPPVSSPEHAALSVAAEALSHRLSMNPNLARLATMPMVTNEVEGLFLVNAQAKAGADLDALKAELQQQVERLSTSEGLLDVQVGQARQRLIQALQPGGLRLLLSSLGGSRLLNRTNLELQRMSQALPWGDLDAYVKRVEGLNGVAVRAAIADHLASAKAIVVRVEPLK